MQPSCSVVQGGRFGSTSWRWPATGVDYSVPWVLQNSETLAACLAHEEIKTCLGLWGKAYWKTPLFKDNDIVTSPMTDAQGSQRMKPFYDMVIPVGVQISNVLPAFQNATKNVRLSAESNVYSSHDFENLFLASLRTQVSGVTKFVLFPMAVLATLAGVTQLSELRDKVKAMQSVDLKVLQEKGFQVSYVELKPNEALFIPSGWFVAQASFNNVDCVAIKKCCLMSEQRAIEARRRSLEIAVAARLDFVLKAGFSEVWTWEDRWVFKIGRFPNRNLFRSVLTVLNRPRNQIKRQTPCV